MIKTNCPNIAKNLFILLIVSFIFASLILTPTYALTSDTINFQGKIVRNDTGYEGLNVIPGTPACVVSGASNDTCDFQVAYYTASTGGTLLLTETFLNREIGEYEGIFELSLGSGSVTTTGQCRDGTCNTVGEVISEYGDIYLELKFAPDGTNLTETFNRMPLEASAYSIFSKYAEGAHDAFKLSTSISSQTQSSPTTGMVYYNTTAGEVQVYNGSGWENISGESLWTDAGTFTYLTSASDDLVLGANTVAGSTFFFDMDGSSGSYFEIDNGANTERLFTILANGNVGIGTASPGAKLEVAGASSTITNSTGNLTISTGGLNGNIIFSPHGTGTVLVESTFGIKETGTTPTYYTYFQGGDQGGNITYTLPVNDGDASQVLTSNGSGVLSWSTVLTGASRWNEIAAPNGNTSMSHGTYTTSFTFTNTTTSSFSLTGNSISSGKLFSLASSSVGLTGSVADITLSGSNAANTGSLLSLNNTGTLNTGTTMVINHYATGTNNLAFRVNDVSADTTPFVIDGNGNVGIGTTTPEGSLTVNGSVGIGDNASITQASHFVDIYSTTDYGGSNESTLRVRTAVEGNLTGTEMAALAYRNSNWRVLYAQQGSAGSALYTDGNVHFMNGSVGLGTTSPQSIFNIYHATDPKITLQNSTTGVTSTDGFYISEIGSNAYLWNREDGEMYFAVNNGTALTIQADKDVIVNSGNVGIGDTTPASLFTVGNNDVFQVSSTGDLVSIKGVSYVWPSANATGMLTNNGSGTLSWTDLNAGDELLPTGTEGQMLYNNAGVWTAYSGMYWDDVNSRLGIGTTSPSTKFDLVGNMKTSGSIFSDESGPQQIIKFPNVYEPVNFGASTGAIKIKLPARADNAMVKIIVDIYSYSGSQLAATYEIGGYNIGGSFTASYAYTLTGKSFFLNLPVRFGDDSTNLMSYIIIGNTDTAWGSYSPSVVIREVQITGWGASTSTNWQDPNSYEITMTTDTTGLTLSTIASTTSPAVLAGSVSGLTAGSIPYASSAGSLTQNNANLFWDATNARIGLGTNTTTARITLGASTAATGGIDFGGDTPLYRSAASILKTRHLYPETTGTYNLGNSSLEWQYIYATRIIGSAYINSDYFARYSVNNTAFFDSTAGNPELRVYGNDGAFKYGYMKVDTNGAFNILSQTGEEVKLGANNTVGLTIATSNNVGIGDTSPASLFTVGNNDVFQVSSTGDLVSIKGVSYVWPSANATGMLTNNGSGTLSWTDLNAGDELLPTGTEGQMLYNNAGAWTAYSGMYWDDTNSRLGIGTTSPGAKLQINTGADATKGLIIRGNTSQSANLTEWQNSGGTILASVDRIGHLSVNNIQALYGGSAQVDSIGGTSYLPYMTDAYSDQFIFKPVTSLEYDTTGSGNWVSQTASNANVLLDNSQSTSLAIPTATAKGFRVVINTGAWLAPQLFVLEQSWASGSPSGSAPLEITLESSPNGTDTWTVRKATTAFDYHGSSTNKYVWLTGHTSDPYWRVTVVRTDTGTQDLRVQNIKLLASSNMSFGYTRSLPYEFNYDKSFNFYNDSMKIKLASGQTANAIEIKNSSGTDLALISSAGGAYFASNVGIGDTTPASLFTVGNGDLFQVNSSGDLIKIKNVTYSWPSANASGVLTNNGSGTLSWTDLNGGDELLPTGTEGQMLYNNAGTWTAFNGMYWEDVNSRLGIGTTSPLSSLDLNNGILSRYNSSWTGLNNSVIIPTQNILAFADKNSNYTVTLSSQPDSGSVSSLFDGNTGTTALWYDAKLPLTIQIDLDKQYNLNHLFGVGFYGQYFAKDIKIEVYNGNTSTWYTIVDTTSNADDSFSFYQYYNYVTKVKFTFNTSNSSGRINISTLVDGNTMDRKGYYVNKGGDTMYGALTIKGTTSDSSAFGLNVTDSANASNFYVRNDGNVGIGTTTPGSRLDVTASTSNALVNINQTNTWSGSEWALSVTGYTNLNGFRINAADGIRALHKVTAGGVMGFSTQGDDPITFTQSSSTERMRIATGGNVGIGDTTPASLFTVGSGDLFQVNSSGDLIKIKNVTYSWPSSNSSGVLTNNGSGTLTWTNISSSLLPTGTEGQMLYNNAGTWTAFNGMYWDDVNSRLGIGTTSPTAYLDIESPDATSLHQEWKRVDTGKSFNISLAGSDWRLSGSAGENILLAVDASSLNTTNLVGIGSSNPGAKLQIDTGADATKGLIVKANSATQSANLTEWQNSAGTVLGAVTPTGAYYIGSSSNYTTAFTVKGSWSASTYGMILDLEPSVTISGYGGYGIYSNPSVTLTNSSWKTIESSINNLVVTGTNDYRGFHFSQPANLTGTLTSQYGIYINSLDKATSNYAIYTNTGLNRLGDQLSILGSADRTQLIVKANSTQTVNLQEWQNSSGVGLSVISGSGYLGVGDSTPASLFTVGSGDLFQVNSSGDLIKIKNVTYSWPSSNSSGVLTNNGSGTLTWTNISSSLLPTGTEGQMLYNNAGTWTAYSGMYWDDVNSRLGIGTTSPQSTAHVYGASSINTISGIFGRGYQVDSTNYGSFGANSRVGLVGATYYSSVPNLPINPLGTQYASAGLVGIGGGTSGGGSGIGVFGYGQTVDARTGFTAGGRFIAETNGDITAYEDLYGVYAKANGITNTVGADNLYGVYGVATGQGTDIAYAGYFSATGGATNYGIYSVAGNNYFNGSVGIGTTSPDYTLQVNGTIAPETTDQDLGTSSLRWDVYGNTINADSTVTLTGLGTGTDNSVVILNSSNQLTTDEIDSRVWGTSLVDGSGTTGQLSYWVDANTLGSLSYSGWDTNASDDVTAFLGLTDTPSAYTGNGGYLVRVNSGGTALEFVAASTYTDTNDYVDSVGFNTSNGVLTLGRTGALPDLTTDLDGRYLQSEADTLATVTGRGASTATALSLTGGATVRGLTVDNATATHDLISITAAATGAARYTGTITNADLTAARTWTFPNNTGTVALTTDIPAGATYWTKNAATLYPTTSGDSVIPNGTASIGASGTRWQYVYGTYGNFSTSTTTPLIVGSTSLALRPSSNGTTAIQLQNAAGTSILNVDTTNSRVGIGKNDPTVALDVVGDIKASGVIRNVTVSGTTDTAAATAAKTATISNYTLTTGDLLSITFTNGNSVSTPTLNINSVGAVNIRLGNTDVNTTNMTLAAGSTVLMYYDGTYFQIMGSQRTADSNTYDRTYWGNNIRAGAAIYDYKLLMQKADGKWYPLTLEEGTGTTKTVSTEAFTINSPILYYATTTNIAANGTLSNVYSEIPTTYLNYTANQASWTTELPIYLVGTIDSSGNFVLDNTSYTSFMTQTLPSTEDGKVYILLGQMYSTTGLRLFQYHPIYEYRNGGVRPYAPEASVKWSSLFAPTDNTSIDHSTYTTAFSFGATNTTAFSMTGNSLTTGKLLSLTSSYADAGNVFYVGATGAHTGAAAAIVSATATGNALNVTGDSITSGVVTNISSTSTEGTTSGSSIVLNIARSGVNTYADHTAYGVYSTVSNTNVTSGTNIAGYFSASGATTANYGLLVPEGYVGIGTGTPSRLLDIDGDMRLRGFIYDVNDESGTSGQILSRSSSGVDWIDASALSGVDWDEIGDPSSSSQIDHGATNTIFTFNGLTSGAGFQLSSNSTAGTASSYSRVLDITRSGVNANASHTAYGVYSAVTNSGSSSTNVGGYFSASGGTSNFGLIVGNGNVGIGTTNPSTSKLVVNTSSYSTIQLQYGGTAVVDIYSNVSSNIFMGLASGQAVTSGIENVAYGFNALTANTTGTRNVAIGHQTMTTNVAKQGSTAIGYQAMMYAHNTTTGSLTYNTAIGYQALVGSATAANNTGTGNTAVGHQSLTSNTSGSSNTALGVNALNSNATGGSNVALGYNAAFTNVAKGGIVAIGYEAMRYAYSNSTVASTYNIGIGYQALMGSTTAANNSGVGNTALGYQAGMDVTSGNYNTLIGYIAGDDLTTGINNTIIGYNAGQNLTTGGSNILIGNGTSTTTPAAGTSNWMNIGNAIYANLSTGNVGIDTGSAVPGAKLQIGAGTYGPGANLSGNRLQISSSSGWAYMTIGNADGANTHRYIGGASGIQAFGVVSDAGSTTEHMRITSTGNVGIGDSNPLSLLSVGTGGLFRVDSAGDLTRVKGVTYSWPSANATGILANNGSGTLSWSSLTSLGGALGTGAAGRAAFWTDTNTLSSDSNFAWDNVNKRLGIGTSTPQYSLDIAGSTSEIGNTAGDITINPTGNLILSDGRFGIGTTNPQASIDIAGATSEISNVSGDITINPAANLIITDGNVGIGESTPTGVIDAIYSTSAGTRKMVLTSSGLRFRRTGDTAAWAINGYGFSSNNGTDLGGFGAYGTETSLNYYYIGTTYSSPLMSISSGGAVGIGVASATKTLEVAGNMKMSYTNTGTGSTDIFDTTYTQSVAAPAGTINGGMFKAIFNTTGTMYDMAALKTDIQNTSSGTVSRMFGFRNEIHNESTGTVTLASSIYGRGYQADAAGTISGLHTFWAEGAYKGAAGTITGQTGLTVSGLTTATNNTHILLGTASIPTGNYAIYSSTSSASYFAGDLTTSRAFVTGLSSSWGVTSGVNTGGVNVTMGTSSAATWLISGTSGGTFRAGLQALDSSGILRIYSNSSYVSFDGGAISATGAVNVGSLQINSTTPTLTFNETDQVAWTYSIDGDQWLVKRSGVDKLVVNNAGSLIIKGDLSNNEDSTVYMGATASSSSLRLKSNNSDTLTLYSNGNVGVGNTAPAAKLTVGSNITGSAASTTFQTNAGSLGTAIYSSLKLASIGFTSSNQSSLTILGYRHTAGTNWDTTSIGIGMSVDSSTYVNDAALWISHHGHVGIGAGAMSYKFEVTDNDAAYTTMSQNTYTGANKKNLLIRNYSSNGSFATSDYLVVFSNTYNWGVNGRINGNGTGIQYTTSSDARLKTNVSSISNALDTLMKMDAVTYNWINGGAKDAGFLAQDLQPLYPFAVSGSPDGDPIMDPMTIDYGKLTPIIVAAIKDLNKKVDSNVLGIQNQIEEIEDSLGLLPTPTYNISTSGWYRISQLNGPDDYAKIKVNNSTLGSSQNLILSVDTVGGNNNVNIISNFTTGGYDISKARINEVSGIKYLEIYLENVNNNSIKVDIDGDITNWISTNITKVDDTLIVEKEYEFSGLLFGVSDTLEVEEGSMRVKGNLLTNSDELNNIGEDTNRWNDIYAKGAIRLGSGVGNEGAIRFNVENQVLEFSNDGTTWVQLGDLSSQTVISPEYPGAILFADGSDNFGNMTSDAEESTGSFRNYYEWISDRETLQDYDILVRVTLPSDFVSWKDDAIYLDFMTENSASINNNKVDMYLMGSNGIDAQVNDGISKLPGAWERVSIKAIDINDCNNAGDTCTLRISLSSLQSYFVRVGDITLNYNRGL
ncbi:MAG: tail fiber domain-containing protein [Candidatus Dojkabacteria bacterium]|jgi:hypothetical protein|nr:tail fiber domain-containing protein [Candidatus Dojkabacteria bacterium]